MRNSYNKNFTLRLALVDGYISQNETKDALSSLKKAQKSAYSAVQRLSVIKRYRMLGAEEQAEKFLLASMKKLPDSTELTAVYVQTMLDKGNLEEAALYAPKLKGTWFDSLYAETCLRQVESPDYFYDDSFFDLYQSAYKTTGDERWLRNSAALLASQGNLKDAARLHPGKYAVDEEPYFWVLLDYDAENYNRAIEGCDFIMENVPSRSDDARLIRSDSLLQKGDLEQADVWWLSQIEAMKGFSDDRQPVGAPALIYKNAAHYAVVNDDAAVACNLLNEVTDLYPDYVPALVAYINYAIKGEEVQKSLDAEYSMFRTVAMKSRDGIPHIPLEKAVEKLEDSLYVEITEGKGGTKLADDYSPELLVEYTRFCWQMQNVSEQHCVSEIWSLLEKTRLTDYYQPYIVHWAVCWLCSHHNETTAASLFKEYLASRYGAGAAVDRIDELEDWECELAAWFAIGSSNYEQALRLYENRLYERETQPDVSVLMNCAALYNVERSYRKALEVYSALAPSIDDPVTLSEVQYRIAVIQYNLNEKRNALLSLTYSVKLNPNNHRARLLLKQIE